jgi:hypothetical protein
MLHNNRVSPKNGYTPLTVYNSIDWTLSFNMTTIIMIVSCDGQVFNVSFADKLTSLFSYATQMSITTEALIFYVPLSANDVKEFFTQNAINYTESSILDPVAQKLVLDDTIRCVLMDIVNIDIFHMMSNYMMMDIDGGIDAIDIDDDAFWNDLMDIDYGIVC